jgi:hypothetical protein
VDGNAVSREVGSTPTLGVSFFSSLLLVISV